MAMVLLFLKSSSKDIVNYVFLMPECPLPTDFVSCWSNWNIKLQQKSLAFHELVWYEIKVISKFVA